MVKVIKEFQEALVFLTYWPWTWWESSQNKMI